MVILEKHYFVFKGGSSFHKKQGGLRLEILENASAVLEHCLYDIDITQLLYRFYF